VLSNIKDIADILQAIVIVIASIVAGYWTLWLFRRRRQSYPRATLKHEVSHKVMSNGRVLLNLATTISNIGEVKIELPSAQTWVYQVLPAYGDLLEIDKPQSEVDPSFSFEKWNILGRRNYKWDKSAPLMEPGECLQLPPDNPEYFVLESNIQVAFIFTQVDNAVTSKRDKRAVGWRTITIYDLRSVQDGVPQNGAKS